MSTQIQEKDFEKIYKQTYNKLLKYIVIKCNNIDDINDILQETYIELLRVIRKKKVLEIDNTENFIFGISNNIIKRHYHKKKKENIISIYSDNKEDSDIDILDTFDLEQDFITKENVEEVWRYINTKELLTIKIFYLYFVLGLKISEISNELNVNESNVKNKIYRTLKEIKKYIVKRK
jgi:RNA polymerase sigma-70 factor (ECF subfamily)